ncbi:MAG: hypothetical protein IK062_03395 [Selenomonadaceae bacterium]|nr:hypothetical protein [Selenomonadaceae bacterium]
MNWNDNEEQERLLLKAMESAYELRDNINKLNPEYREKFFKIIFGEGALEMMIEHIKRNF